ncbi:NUDIX hydrolase [Actinomycetospora cinnamomea]|uniref:Isopentenyldiphosphate isomerase n=1 Tax=Actinomycetospora cinnamomea TaxID=663609 RepID=A0A2U1FFM2_9PSEU|nr:CoA pyrophosphatase [Actinomycetospora cinnamomea]PVZ10968.1 isopentenyldiphosphate isomerase [Actinomycetospora cinnamomea]
MTPATPSAVAARVTAHHRDDRRAVHRPDLRHAAVAVVVLDDPARGPGVLLTRRTSRLRDHPGQFALPGGSLDPGEDVVTAARRELDEELGLRLDEEAVLGLLDDYPTRSGFVITPVVMAASGAVADLRPSPDEVSELFHITLGELDVEPRYVAIEESPRPVVQMPLVGHSIHAPTAAVLLQFREVALHGRTTRVDGLEQPVFAWR